MAEQHVAGMKQGIRSEGFVDVLQMLSGVVLILFMWSHMILVASVNLGSGTMNAIARLFEDTYMAQVGGPVIFFIFLVHFVLTSRKLPFRGREQTVIWRHSLRLRHGDTWLWMIQAATAMFILIMGVIHMWVVLTDLPISAAKSAARIQRGWWLAFYMVLLPLIELHVGIGFYRVAVKWGVVDRDNRGFFKSIEHKLTWIFILIGAVTLFTFFYIIEA